MASLRTWEEVKECEEEPFQKRGGCWPRRGRIIQTTRRVASRLDTLLRTEITCAFLKLFLRKTKVKTKHNIAACLFLSQILNEQRKDAVQKLKIKRKKFGSEGRVMG